MDYLTKLVDYIFCSGTLIYYLTKLVGYIFSSGT